MIFLRKQHEAKFVFFAMCNEKHDPMIWVCINNLDLENLSVGISICGYHDMPDVKAGIMTAYTRSVRAAKKTFNKLYAKDHDSLLFFSKPIVRDEAKIVLSDCYCGEHAGFPTPIKGKQIKTSNPKMLPDVFQLAINYMLESSCPGYLFYTPLIQYQFGTSTIDLFIEEITKYQNDLGKNIIKKLLVEKIKDLQKQIDAI